MTDTYIEEAINSRKPVAVFVLNGFQIRGCVLADNGDSIVINSGGKNKLVFKHAISTIEPVQENS